MLRDMHFPATAKYFLAGSKHVSDFWFLKENVTIFSFFLVFFYQYIVVIVTMIIFIIVIMISVIYISNAIIVNII